MTAVTIVMQEQLQEWGSDDKNSNYKEYNSDENRDSEDDSNEDPILMWNLAKEQQTPNPPPQDPEASPCLAL